MGSTNEVWDKVASQEYGADERVGDGWNYSMWERSASTDRLHWAAERLSTHFCWTAYENIGIERGGETKGYSGKRAKTPSLQLVPLAISHTSGNQITTLPAVQSHGQTTTSQQSSHLANRALVTDDADDGDGGSKLQRRWGKYKWPNLRLFGRVSLEHCVAESLATD